MTKTTTLTRIERLEWLKSRLKVDAPIILRDIAEEFGVSMRTINRDVQLLREQGVPIETERGRGGGTRVNSTWGIGRIALTFDEVVDLLISTAAIEKMELPMMFTDTRKIRTKLISSFSKPNQTKVKKLASRIKVGPVSSPQILSTYQPKPSRATRDIHKSFLLMNIAEIYYRKSDGTVSKRTIEPHYMILNYPVWYLSCWDHLRKDIRTFRCDRLEKVNIHDQFFHLRPWENFQKSMEGNALINV